MSPYRARFVGINLQVSVLNLDLSHYQSVTSNTAHYYFPSQSLWRVWKIWHIWNWQCPCLATKCLILLAKSTKGRQQRRHSARSHVPLKECFHASLAYAFLRMGLSWRPLIVFLFLGDIVLQGSLRILPATAQFHHSLLCYFSRWNCSSLTINTPQLEPWEQTRG